MTLPFRGRHHDGESSHERARALTSAGMFEAVGEDDAAWLARHLEGCGECRTEHEAWQADRQLVRSLRDRPMEPPRDLWARTSAAIDREARGARRRRSISTSRRTAGREVWRGLPLGAAAGALVVLIVVGTSVFTTPQLPNGTPGGTLDVAVNTPAPQPTNLTLSAAADVGWIRRAASGSWELVLEDVDEVCPRASAGCALFGQEAAARPLDLGDDTTGLTISPNAEQLVVASRASGSSSPGKVFVVPVPSESPEATAEPATPDPASTSEPATPDPASTHAPVATPEPQATAEPTAVITAPPASPSESPIVVPTELPGTTPPGAIEILSGVTMVGEAAYNEDGTWLAFSARPADNSTGPDLYLWEVGADEATPVTTDHETYFSAWLDGQVLASSVVVAPEPTGPTGSSEPAASPEGTPAAAAHPSSFLLDPGSGVRTDLTQPDVWLPVVDPEGRFTAYWSGTLVRTADGLGWQLDEGSLVLDEWVAAGESPAVSADANASTDPASPVVGPAGRQTAIEVGDVANFQAKFDPEGLRVAVWAADEPDATVGRLHLVVLDPATGTVDATVAPLPGAPALRRFSLDQGRLAWVSPRGQDGQESAVQVLGWAGREFGEIQTIPAKDLFIVR